MKLIKMHKTSKRILDIFTDDVKSIDSNKNYHYKNYSCLNEFKNNIKLKKDSHQDYRLNSKNGWITAQQIESILLKKYGEIYDVTKRSRYFKEELIKKHRLLKVKKIEYKYQGHKGTYTLYSINKKKINKLINKIEESLEHESKIAKQNIDFLQRFSI